MRAPDVSGDRFWVGADPGGSNSFGLALLNGLGESWTFCVSSADEAADLVKRAPLGVGVDAPLWWSSGRSSDRMADRWLRSTYGIASGTVQAGNSLRGAALIQGMMFVARLRERFQDVRVTEAHPKALAAACGGWGSLKIKEIFGTDFLGNEHERDALCAAHAARLGFSGRWPHDLSVKRENSEQDPKDFWLAPVNYFWFE